MLTFTEFLKLKEDLWNTSGPQDNPSNPGTKRKDAKHPYNQRFGSAAVAPPTIGKQPSRMSKK
jgi:hypothetical protein